MLIVRSLLYSLSMILSIVIFSPVVLLSWPLPMNFRSRIGTSWGQLNLWLMKELCGLDYRLQGAEHLPDGSAIVMAKHQSSWEIFALRALIGGNQSWVLKQQLTFLPIFGWAVMSMGNIAIDRKAGRKAVEQLIDQGASMLKRGHNVIIFPEGTRTAPGTKGRYKLGGAILAEATSAPIVPIAHNAGFFWRRRSLVKYPGVIDVVIGEAISTKGKSVREIIDETEAWIEGQMNELNRLN